MSMSAELVSFFFWAVVATGFGIYLFKGFGERADLLAKDKEFRRCLQEMVEVLVGLEAKKRKSILNQLIRQKTNYRFYYLYAYDLSFKVEAMLILVKEGGGIVEDGGIHPNFEFLAKYLRYRTRERFGFVMMVMTFALWITILIGLK